MHSQMEKFFKKILVSFPSFQPTSIDSLWMQGNLNHIVY